jgi:hypothetical protein
MIISRARPEVALAVSNAPHDRAYHASKFMSIGWLMATLGTYPRLQHRTSLSA